jgi:drug/metabolite transporter (DMT)-like permease
MTGEAPAAKPAAKLASGRDYALLLLISAMWGGSFPLIKLAVASLPPLWVAGGRISLGALTLLLLMRLRGAHLPRGRAVWARLAYMGVAGNILPFALISWGEIHVASGIAAILMAMVPMMVVVVAHFTLPDEPLTLGKSLGLGLGIVGILVLIGPSALSGLGSNFAGELAILLATVSYASAALAARGLPAMAAESISAGVLLLAAPAAIVLAAVVDPPWTLSPTSSSLIAIALLGFFSTGIAYAIFFAVLARAGAGFASMNNFLVPPFGVIYGRMGLAERLPVSAFAAMALILAGLAAQRLRWRRP